MDDRLKVEFPLGELKIIVSEPTQGQLFALSLSRTSHEGGRVKAVYRALRVLELLVGPDQWEIIEESMITGDTTPETLVKMTGDVFEFRWSDHKAPEDVPDTSPEPPHAPPSAPRVVSGG